jgi:hypothetical protein
LLETKAAGYAKKIGKPWFKLTGERSLLSQGRAQEAAAKRLGVPVLWLAEKVPDRDAIRNLFHNAQPPINIRVEWKEFKPPKSK